MYYETRLVLESRLGYVDVKSSESGIYFYVQISNPATAPVPLANGVLRYDHQVSNIGGGMNLKTGVFTAPKAGLYTFSFSMSKTGHEFDFMDINLRVNGVRIGKAGRVRPICEHDSHAVHLEIEEEGST